MTLYKWLAVGLFVGWQAMAEAAPTSRPGAHASSVASAPDAPGATSQFRVTDQTEIPGKTLKAGAYTIRILDHLTDRMIVQVDHNGKAESTFLALSASSLPRPAGQGAILVTGSKNGRSALRGFAFPNGVLAEFVYPKAAAVGLAKANNTTIPAIDPASEGMANGNHLSDTDRQTVTLWMLTPSPVGPNDSGPGVTAARYQVPAPAASASTGSTDVASAKTPLRPARVRPAALKATTALPHTASDLPLVWMLGFGAAAGASLLARRRRTLGNA